MAAHIPIIAVWFALGVVVVVIEISILRRVGACVVSSCITKSQLNVFSAFILEDCRMELTLFDTISFISPLTVFPKILNIIMFICFRIIEAFFGDSLLTTPSNSFSNNLPSGG